MLSQPPRLKRRFRYRLLWPLVRAFNIVGCFIPLMVLGVKGGVAQPGFQTRSMTIAQNSEPFPPLFAFLDVPQGYWARGFILPLAERGLLEGFPDGNFHPNQSMTRAEFAVLLSHFPWSQWLNLAEMTPYGDYFSDVPSTSWAAADIEQVAQWGLMRGDPDQRFRPQSPISRLEVLLTLSTVLKSRPNADRAVLSYYHDQFIIPTYAQESIALATVHQFVVSYPDPHFLNPTRFATRAEACAFLHQLLVYQGIVHAVESPYIAKVQEPHS